MASTSPQRLQFARQGIGPLRDVPGAKADHIIAAAGDAADYFGKLGGTFQRNNLAMTMSTQAEDKVIAIDARYRRLAGRIDFRDHDRVGIVEAGAKLLEQLTQPGEAMRLYHGDDLAVGGFPRRL